MAWIDVYWPEEISGDNRTIKYAAQCKKLSTDGGSSLKRKRLRDGYITHSTVTV